MKSTTALAVVTSVCLPVVLSAADERTCTMRDAAVPSTSITYVLCEQGFLLATTNDGAEWKTLRMGEFTGFRALAFLDANRGFAAGEDGAIVTTEDGGKTWTAHKTGTKENLSDLQMIGDEGWAVGYDGVILHTADGGRTWSAQNSTVTQSLEAVHFLDAKNGWAVGWSGTVLHTTDGGKTWQQVKSGSASWSLSSIFFLDAKNGFISGFAGQLIRTKDGGATWEPVKAPYSGWLTSVAFDKAGRGWITTDDGLLLTTDGGTTWKMAVEDSQAFLTKVISTPTGLLALGPFGLMKQTSDGMGWKKIGNPLSDENTIVGK
jgi:photosystem II stability/assembly factor-like uncharacterized protein